jgi:H+/gluconate symporter-like permease
VFTFSRHLLLSFIIGVVHTLTSYIIFLKKLHTMHKKAHTKGHSKPEKQATQIVLHDKKYIEFFKKKKKNKFPFFHKVIKIWCLILDRAVIEMLLHGHVENTKKNNINCLNIQYLKVPFLELILYFINFYKLFLFILES